MGGFFCPPARWQIKAMCFIPLCLSAACMGGASICYVYQILVLCNPSAISKCNSASWQKHSKSLRVDILYASSPPMLVYPETDDHNGPNRAEIMPPPLSLRQRKEMLQRDEKRWLSSEQVSLSLGWLPTAMRGISRFDSPTLRVFSLTHSINETLFSLRVH